MVGLVDGCLHSDLPKKKKKRPSTLIFSSMCENEMYFTNFQVKSCSDDKTHCF